MKVQNIMTTSVKFCDPYTNLAEVARIMWDNDCGAVPVVDRDGKLIGTITDRDICIAVGTNHRAASDIAVGEVISGHFYACTPEDGITAALEAMRLMKVRRLPIIDSVGALRGILSINDLVLHAENGGGKKVTGTTYEDVVDTLKAICEHRILEPQEEQGKARPAGA